jgi:hypothetical protein
MTQRDFNFIKPYCYYLKRISDGKQYFGVRWKNITKYKRTPVDDFGKYYFSSHAEFKNQFKNNKKNFVARLVRTFDTIEEARQYEFNFNKRIIKRNNWINIQAFPQIIHNSVTINKIRKFHLNKKLSEESKLKVRLARLGTTATTQTKKKMSDSQLGKNNHFFGKKHNQISKNKMKGRVVSEEIRRRISEKLKGRKLSLETIKKIIKNKKSYKHSEETKKKISMSLKNKIFKEKL